ncbi:MAG: 4Fe-4S dicluster domain-containing protein [Eubacterium sp.]|nr:4Fe-4S dicluster domain-containing protein [Eubacterium sp.]
MSIEIDKAQCVRCGRCRDACPGNLLVLEADGAAIRDVRDCWGCTACMKACPASAIVYFLGEDIGGRGGRMTVAESDTGQEWRIRLADGRIFLISTKRTQANRY